ncbi:unnamed protein product [Rhizoctonia solani]|uniref:Asl1-like glycosyl hydrolase catalytic domain-containing protein n=1 Tax=Rhizoctonia solani TaxID=456999 RepID=A0A8H3H7W2_9AGAM|nr:unnamed protein product [Rhizoctonia solani]
MELPGFIDVARCLAEAASTMSTAAEAMALAAQAFSSASTELEKLCNSFVHVKNPTTGVPLGLQIDEPQPGLNIGSAGGENGPEGVWGTDRGRVLDTDYYLSDEDSDKHINALLKRQQSQEPHLHPKGETNQTISPALHPSLPPVSSNPAPQISLVPADSQPNCTSRANDTPNPMTCFERHLLVDLETDIIPTVCVLTQRFPKVICYMQYALPSIMTYHKIIKHITESTVYAITRPSISQSDNTWGAFNRQERVIILLPETLSSNTPLRAVGDVCVIHVGWPSSAQRYRSQLALHDAPCSVLIACLQDKETFSSCGELISETSPWPLEDKKSLGNEVSRLFPKFEAALSGIPREIKEKIYQDWIEAHGPRGQRYVSTWDAVALVNRANLYISDVLGYNGSTTDWSLPRFPPVPPAFVSRNGLGAAVDNGVLFLAETDAGLNHPMDHPKDVSPMNKPTSVPEEPKFTGVEVVRPTESVIMTNASEPRKSRPEGILSPLTPDRGKTAVPGLSTTELFADGKPGQLTVGTNDTKMIGSGDSNKTGLTPKRAATKIREYFVVLEDFHLIPAICMLAREKSYKNVICYVQIVGVIQTLINQIHTLTSKPIFIVTSSNSATLSEAVKAFDSPAGGIIFLNYLHPLCQPLRTKSIHRIIHAGWTGKPALYSQQVNAIGNAQNCIIMTQSQYSAIPDPDTIFGAPGLNVTRNLLDPTRFDTMVAQWESQLNHTPEKALNGCYMVEAPAYSFSTQLDSTHHPPIPSSMSSIPKIATLAVAVLAATPSVLAGKRGLAWPWYNENTNLDPTKLANGNGNVQWIYNWETWRPAKTTNMNWVGMQRCMDCDSSPISQLKTRAAQQGWNTVLTLNEPDINGISAATAANWYIQYINPLQIKKAIPSVTSSTTPGQGLDWTAAFISTCAGRCYFDYINIHWYGHNFAQFQSHVQSAHNRFPNYKLIISEFALVSPATRDQQVAFLKSAMSFLDGASYVTYYAVFGASSPSKISANTGGGEVGTGSSLYNDDGSLSANGVAYRG